MRWNKENTEVRKERLAVWHRWFAWHPIVCEGKWVWMETVCRRGELKGWYDASWYEWEYRLID